MPKQSSNVGRITWPGYKPPSRSELEGAARDFLESEEAARYLLVIGTPITRRKRYSFVYSPMGDIMWSDRDAASCIDWLATNEIWDYDIETSSRRYSVKMR